MRWSVVTRRRGGDGGGLASEKGVIPAALEDESHPGTQASEVRFFPSFFHIVEKEAGCPDCSRKPFGLLAMLADDTGQSKQVCGPDLSCRPPVGGPGFTGGIISLEALIQSSEHRTHGGTFIFLLLRCPLHHL